MICLTFDTDYVQPRDMEKFLNEFPIPGRGTFFLDRPYPNVDFKNHELGPHPIIMDGDKWSEKIALSENYVHGGQKKGFRSHSLVFSQSLAAQLGREGYTYTSIEAPFFQAGLKPRRQPWGLWELPIYYMDNADFCYDLNWPRLKHQAFNKKHIQTALYTAGTYVFDFHPLHIILNTRTYADYQLVRSKVLAGESLFNLKFDGYGTRSFYLDMVEEMLKAGQKSYSGLEAIQAESTLKMALDKANNNNLVEAYPSGTS